jgi:hypothetical protein
MLWLFTRQIFGLISARGKPKELHIYLGFQTPHIPTDPGPARKTRSRPGETRTRLLWCFHGRGEDAQVLYLLALQTAWPQCVGTRGILFRHRSIGYHDVWIREYLGLHRRWPDAHGIRELLPSLLSYAPLR